MKDWIAAARANPLFPMVLILSGTIILFDQATKLWIVHGLKLQDRPFGRLNLSSVFDLTYVENRGVSFGLFAGGMTSRILLTILAVTIAVFVVRWAGRLDRRVAAIGAGFIIGGAIGNAIDRAFYGYVVDFLDFKSIGFPWVFNIADTAINLGVACLAYDAFFVSPKPAAGRAQSAPDASANLAANPELPETEDDAAFPDRDGMSITPENQRSRRAE